MTFRQFMVCLIIGPICAAFLFSGIVLVSPLMLVICLLMGDAEPIRTTWEIVTEPPIGTFKEAYRGGGR